jgi:hypothetical protein
MTKTAKPAHHGKRKAADRHAHHQPQVAPEAALLNEIRARGWQWLIATITALVLEGTPTSDDDLPGELERVDSWLRRWLSEPETGRQ